MNAVTERIAAAPISWGVSEVPTWGHQMSPERVFEEMKSLGFLASELGPNGYFANDEKVARSLKVGGFSIVAGFVPLTFRFPEAEHDTNEKLHDIFARLSGSGRHVLLLWMVASAYAVTLWAGGPRCCPDAPRSGGGRYAHAWHI